MSGSSLLARVRLPAATLLALVLATAPFVLARHSAAQAAATGVRVSDAAVDRIFAKWTAATPGCAVGASVDGHPALARAYGLADLEQDTRNTPDTIFEAGSVSKQFTAAAVLLLAREGKLSLDDPVRTYMPELPDYGTPITIRHILTHTSGLRDWGSVEEIAGWPRTTRVYTQAHVLDILGRQRDLNFPPGAHWSYSNSGYNLAAMIVTRVSGMSFADFTRRRIFEPLGMTQTSWRDDHTRIVKHRAIAYAQERDGFHTEMPFEDVYGNSSLLTTVGDLLRWNENFTAPKVGDAAFVAEEQRSGVLADGHPHNYGLGLMIGSYRGVPEIGHSGATAGYRADLVRYPAQHVSIAVLCNVDSAPTVQYAHDLADLLLADHLKPAGKAGPRPQSRDAAPPPSLSAAQLPSFTGTYVSDEAEATLVVAIGSDGQTLVIHRRPATTLTLTPVAPDTFNAPQLGKVTFRRDAADQVTALSVSQDRVWDLRFIRSAAPASDRSGTPGGRE
jgi:CubicO group peptidase (beta-lactamase class C family)